MRRQKLIDEVIDWHEQLRRTVSGAEIIRAIEDRIDRETDPVKRWYTGVLLAQQHAAHGNHALACELRQQDPHHQIDRWHHELSLRRDLVANIGAIEERIRRETDPLQLRHLKKLLAMDHTSAGNYASAEAIRRQLFEEDQDDPMPLISLAEQKLYYEEQPEDAMRIIDTALEPAYRSGTYRRHALAVKARIALQLNHYHVVEDVMRKIMELQFKRGNFDIGRERDILDRLPPGSIDPEIARQYDEYCRANKKRSAGERRAD